MEIDHRTVSQKPIEAHFCTRHAIIIEKQQKGIPIQTRFGWGFPFFLKKDRRKCDGLLKTQLFRFYNLFWGAKVTVQMRVLSAPTFFSIKK